MMKKVLNLLTALVMVISLAGVLPVMTAMAEISGDYEYTVLYDGTVEITGYTGSETEIEIPSEINGKAVTSIGDFTFTGCDSLTSVTIGNNVTSIGDFTFTGCYNLTSVTIPDSVTSIGNSAFVNCESLTSITIPNSVTSIGEAAFLSCENLIEINVDSNNTNYSSENGVLFNYDKTELIQYPMGNIQTTYTIPNSVKSIWDNAFWGCTSLTNITIPNSVTSIGYDAFANCSLTSVTIPNSVTNIGGSAFNWCDSLTEINVDSDNNDYSSQDGVLFNYDKTELITYPRGKTQASYTIPKSVISIGNEAFKWCTSLTNITIPNSVTSIGNSAFSKCTSLTSITIPDSVTNIGGSAFEYCESLTNVTIGNSVTSIEDDAFYFCFDLTIKCYKGSYAEQYAIENDLKYELLDGSKTPNNPNNNQSNKPNNNSNKPNKTVSPTNNKKTNPSTNKVTVPKPAKVKSVKLTAKKKRLNVQWKKVSGATGYEVMYAKNNKFKGKKTVKVKKNKVTLKRLKSNKKYFVKVRAYKTVNGNISYGKWSKVVKKKVK